ncbi:MAG: glycosyltransferase [Vicinamibacterales bacterium]
MPSSVPTSRSRPRLLVVSERLPRPDESSGSCRFLTILEHLAAAADVDLWIELDETTGQMPLPPSRVEADRARLTSLGIDVLPCTWTAFRRAVARRQYDIVFFEFYAMAGRYLEVVRDLCPRAAAVVDSVDVHFARLASGVALGTVPGQWANEVREAELATYRAADLVIAVSADDADLLRGETGLPPIVCVPNLVRLRPRTRRTRGPDALFVGHFHHAPNLDGLRWFCADVWPGVRERRPDATLCVIGSYARDEVHALGRTPGVRILGYVPDLTPHLDAAAASIAPLRFGAGMKGKVTDAMAAGLPVVTTPVGAQGLDLIPGTHAFVAEDAQAFGDALVQAFSNPQAADAMGLAGQAHVSRICGPEAAARALSAVLTARRGNPAGAPRPHPRWRRAKLALRHRWVALARRHFARPMLEHGGPA